ncbi:MAG: hypothetical protein ACWIPJ_06075 [Polaribacter sp.]
MANIKNLKKDINYTLGDIITYVSDKIDPKGDTEKAEVIIEDTITTFDVLIAKVNEKNVEHKKAHYKEINKELETKANNLIDRVNEL